MLRPARRTRRNGVRPRAVGAAPASGGFGRIGPAFLRLFCDTVCRAALFGFAGIFSSCLFLLSLLTTDDQACILCISNIYRKGAPPVDVIVSNASVQPIYEQIYSQIKAQILRAHCGRASCCRPSAALAEGLGASASSRAKRAYGQSWK